MLIDKFVLAIFWGPRVEEHKHPKEIPPILTIGVKFLFKV